MKVKVGNYNVLSQGTIVSNEGEPIDFVIAEDIGFIIRIIFDNDANEKESVIKADAFGKVGAVLTFWNFNSSLGIGNVEPIQIGTLNYRELFLNYRVYSLEKGGKTFHYTWLLGKESRNEK